MTRSHEMIPAAAAAPAHRAFTLNELLVVIAIAVLVVALAVPAFNVITNARSVDSAENQVSAFVATARLEAVGLQERRGVMFFEDPDTGRPTMAQVYYSPTQSNVNDPIDIELYPARDQMVLPKGVGWQSVPETPTAGSQNYPWAPWGVVMFDRDGKVSNEPFRILNASKLNSPSLVLKDRTGTAIGLPWTGRSTIGFLMFDKQTYDALPTAGPTRAEWLRDNASPYLVNRYNGTLLKGQ